MRDTPRSISRRSWEDEPILTTTATLVDREPLTSEGLSYLQSRGISAATAETYGVFSGARYFRQRKSDSPAGTKGAIGFPYHADGAHYATKWRSVIDKNFTADGSPQSLWGPVSAKDADVLILAEGEVDAMSIYEATGIAAKSIPNGAADRVSSNAAIAWMDRDYDRLRAAGKIILAFDCDKSGDAYAAEIARRLGRQRVWRVRLPDGCKDANEVLVQHGEVALACALEAAEPWPIEGLSSVNDYRDRLRTIHQNGMPPGKSTGWKSIDALMTMEPGMLYIGTGQPGGGKSTWLDNMMVNMSVAHGWRFAIASFETPPELSIARLISVKRGKKFADIAPHEVEEDLVWAEQHFFFLTSDGMVTTDSLTERAQAAVMRWGVNATIIDPVNYISHDGEHTTESVNVMLSKLKTFCMSSGVALVLIAHPAKPQGAPDGWVPTGYAISGSAHYYNRADFGFTVLRAPDEDYMMGDSMVVVWKAKWRHLGKEGRAYLRFDPDAERFYEPKVATNYEEF